MSQTHIELTSGFGSTQEWTSDPEKVVISFPVSFVAKMEQAVAFMKANGFHKTVEWWAAGFTLLGYPDGGEEDLVEFVPEYRLDGCHAEVYADGDVRFVFPFKHSNDEGWTDNYWKLDELRQQAGLTSSESEPIADHLRRQAADLLRQAQALDGLKPFIVAHEHEYGASAYMTWFGDQPTMEMASSVLDAEFEPDRGETLNIEECVTVEELTGVSVADQ